MAIRISAKSLLRRLARGIVRRVARPKVLVRELMIEPDPEALKAWRALLVHEDRT